MIQLIHDNRKTDFYSIKEVNMLGVDADKLLQKNFPTWKHEDEIYFIKSSIDKLIQLQSIGKISQLRVRR